MIEPSLSPAAHAELEALIRRYDPGAVLESVQPLGEDPEKATGYGHPLLLTAKDAVGRRLQLVFRTEAANAFGHEHRADRAASTIMAFDTFSLIPRHIRAIDVGFVTNHQLRSMADGGELYLVTEYAEGTPYAQDLRRIAEGGAMEALDEVRCSVLARSAAGLHQHKLIPSAYRRSVRDVLGHGEGIFGLIDAYPEATPGAPAERLRGLEHLCLEWRWRLRAFEHRASRIHGDFHPFNVVFRGAADFSLLDAARGCVGDPADDVTAMAVNYPFFAIDAPGAWERGLRDLWRTFWRIYLRESQDHDVLLVAPLYLAWRLLVVAHPTFYPHTTEHGRDRLLSLAERALAAERFDPSFAEDLFG